MDDLLQLIEQAINNGGPTAISLILLAVAGAFYTGRVESRKSADTRVAAVEKASDEKYAAAMKRGDEYKAMFDEWGPRFDALLDITERSVRGRKT